jgi:hypothetical protein
VLLYLCVQKQENNIMTLIITTLKTILKMTTCSALLSVVGSMFGLMPCVLLGLIGLILGYVTKDTTFDNIGGDASLCMTLVSTSSLKLSNDEYVTLDGVAWMSKADYSYDTDYDDALDCSAFNMSAMIGSENDGYKDNDGDMFSGDMFSGDMFD